MEHWKFCYQCGWKKPAERFTTRAINGKRRNVCDNCAEDIDMQNRNGLDSSTAFEHTAPLDWREAKQS